ncbi:TonB-dependent receptor [Vitreoscilla sp. C1]|uniref:TonB-dependent receptor domain-containing protein n=1 Tax=Vitreoscilla sp. (strain C1) TaxID=96942 RepID=UPI00148EB1B8|nr:TonB-dependent receptor [Vitreoscilla sp. C1]AUZ04846.2 TonB-dependent receptor [Vitreoscilla sp. C1]
MSRFSTSLRPIAFLILGLSTSVYANDAASDNDTDLGAITVTANQSPSQINSDKVSVRQADSIRDVLRDIPGVYVGGTNNMNQQIQVRGVGETGLNITVDGARQLGTIFHHNGRTLIDTDLIKRVNVDVGSHSVSAGMGALGGAVQFTTVSAEDLLNNEERFGGKVKSSYATNNNQWQNSVMLFGRPTDNTDVLGYVNYKSMNLGESGDNRPLGGDGEEIDYLIKAGWNITPEQKITVSAERNDLSGLYPARMEFPHNDLNSNQFNPLIDQEYTRDTQTLGYAYNPAANEWIDLEAKIYRTKIQLNNGKDAQKYVGVSALNWLSKLEIETVGGTLTNTSVFDTGSVNHNMRVGYEFFDTENQKQDAYTGKISQGESGRLHSVYVEDRLNVGNFSVTPGLRYDHYRLENPVSGSRDYDNVSKALEIAYQFDNGLKAYASYTDLFRAPDTMNAMFLSYANNTDLNTLEAEKGKNKEIGLSYSKSQLLGDDDLSLQVKYFQANYDNIISVSGPRNSLDRKNIGSGDITGFEASARYRYENWRTSVGFSKSDIDLYDGISANNTAIGRDMGAKWNVSLAYDWIGTGISAQWDSTFQRRYTSYNAEKPGYGISDISVHWKPQSGSFKGLETSLGVYNVFDKFYVSQSARQQDPLNPLTDYEMGRNIKATVSYRF